MTLLVRAGEDLHREEGGLADWDGGAVGAGKL